MPVAFSATTNDYQQEYCLDDLVHNRLPRIRVFEMPVRLTPDDIIRLPGSAEQIFDHFKMTSVTTEGRYAEERNCAIILKRIHR